MNPFCATASSSACRSARSGASAESREGRPIISSQQYSKQALRGSVGVDEFGIGLGVVRDHGEGRFRVEPASVLALRHERHADEPLIALGEQGEKFRIGLEVRRHGATIAKGAAPPHTRHAPG